MTGGEGPKGAFGDDHGRVAASAAARSQAPRFGPGRGYMPPRRNALFSAESAVASRGEGYQVPQVVTRRDRRGSVSARHGDVLAASVAVVASLKTYIGSETRH